MLGIHATLALALTPLSGLAPAQQPKSDQQPAQLEIRKSPPLVGSQTLLALPFQNGNSKTFGQLEDLVLHPNGQVAFAIGSYAGWVDMEEELFVVPWSIVQPDLERNVLAVNLNDDQIRDMRRYKVGETPLLDEMGWWEDTDEHYADIKKQQATPVEASVTLAPTKRLYLLSEKKGEIVFSPKGEKLGEIRELALEPKQGRIHFAVISVGSFIGSGGKLVAVPWEALREQPDSNNPALIRTTLAVTAEQLNKAPEFRAHSEKPQFEDPDWILSVYKYYSVPQEGASSGGGH